MIQATKIFETHQDAAIIEEITYGNGKQVVLVRDKHWKIIVKIDL